MGEFLGGDSSLGGSGSVDVRQSQVFITHHGCITCKLDGVSLQ